VLTNRGPRACRVAAGALGSVTVTRAEQDGRAIAAVPAEITFPREPRQQVADRLRVLEPGRSVELRLPASPGGGKGPELLSTRLSSATGSVAFRYPVTPGRPIDVAIRYELPVTPPGDGPPACAAASARGTVAPEDGRRVPGPLVVGAAGVGAGLVAVVLVVVLVRRSRAAAVVTALIVVSVLQAIATPRDAAADLEISPALAAAYGECAKAFTSPGGDPAGLFDVLNEPGVYVGIFPPTPHEDGHLNHTTHGARGVSIISWYPVPHPNPGPRDPDNVCGVLYHELFHAVANAKGPIDRSECVTADGPSGVPVSEVLAMEAENRFRVAALGLPANQTYGGRPLPAGPCQEQPPPPTCTGTCGSSYADPHLRTFDGRHYSFQAVGEFVATRGRGFEVQVRQQPLGAHASVNVAVAMRLGRSRVELRDAKDSITVLVDGRPVPLGRTLRLPGRVTLARNGAGSRAVVTATWPDGTRVGVRKTGAAALRYDVQPAASRLGRLEGLLGDFDGRPENDLRTPDGGTVAAERPAHDDLYPRFADGWRVTQDASLFTYPPGASTRTYTDRSAPARLPDPTALPGWQAAQALCRGRGVTDPVALEDCSFDVAITGDADFAEAAVFEQAFRGDVVVDGPTVAVPVTGSGPPAELRFAGTAGRRLTLHVGGGEGVDVDCGALRVVDRRGGTVAQGCLAKDTGGIDEFTLPADGTYRIVLDPRRGSGTARFTLSSVTELPGRLRPGGPPVGVSIDRPGRVARLTFEAEAGRRYYLGGTGKSPLDCGALAVRAPDGTESGRGCLNGNRSEVDTFGPTARGRHTVVVDPTGGWTGDLRLTLVGVTDTTGTVAVGGKPARAAVTTPGGTARLTFEAAAGQRITVAVTTRDLPADCGAILLVDPRGRTSASGCVSGDTGGIPTTTIRTTGRHTLLLDPGNATTGTAEVTITG
jgi:hypothetical protein